MQPGLEVTRTYAHMHAHTHTHTHTQTHFIGFSLIVPLLRIHILYIFIYRFFFEGIHEFSWNVKTNNYYCVHVHLYPFHAWKVKFHHLNSMKMLRFWDIEESMPRDPFGFYEITITQSSAWRSIKIWAPSLSLPHLLPAYGKGLTLH